MAVDEYGSGMLSKNERKTKDTHPDYTGLGTIDGVDVWISAWMKKGKPGSKIGEGKPFLSLAFSVREARPTGTLPVTNNESSDDFPF